MSSKAAAWLAVGGAMVLPTLLTWAYFIGLASGGASLLQQGTYVGGKWLMLLWPIVAVWLLDGRFPQPGRPHFRGLLPALAFGGSTAAALLGLYFGVLRDSSLLADTPAKVAQKLAEFNLTWLPAYIGFAVLVCFAHALFEEYYWRWFVLGRLRGLLPLAPALVVMGLAFAAHHVLVLHIYFPGQFLGLVVPFSLCVALGGVVWGWLYAHYGSLYSCWLSHALVDAAIFVVGYDLCFRN